MSSGLLKNILNIEINFYIHTVLRLIAKHLVTPCVSKILNYGWLHLIIENKIAQMVIAASFY